MTEWTKEEWVQASRSLDTHAGIVSMNYLATLRTCQRNRALAALKIGRFYTQAYGELAQEIGHPCSTVPEDLQQIDAAIAVCKDDK